jgi:hypothetical protein
MNSVFNLAAVVVMGLIGGGVLVLAPASAHDVCLAIVSGLTGALTGAAAHPAAPHTPNPNPQP